MDGNAVTTPRVAGVDLHYENLSRLGRYNIYDLLIHGNAARLPFKDKSFDTILAFEVMEHMTREDGYVALDEFERLAKKCILISTPNKACLRDGLYESDGFNPHEAHLSWWKIKDFKKKGYRCYGLGTKLPGRLGGVTEFSFLSYRIPFVASHLLCIKTLDGER